jgi:hypothetical protein
MDLLMESVRDVQETESINEGFIDAVRNFVDNAREVLSDIADTVVDFFDEFDLEEFKASIGEFFSRIRRGEDPIQVHLNTLYNKYLEQLDDEGTLDYRLMGTFLDKDVEDYARRNDIIDVQFLQGLVLAAIIGRGKIGDYQV